MPKVYISLSPLRDDVGSGGAVFTDEKGRFKIESVPPGSYVLVLNEDGRGAAESHFPGCTIQMLRRGKGLLSSRSVWGDFVKNLKVVAPAVQETNHSCDVVRYANQKPGAKRYVGFKAAEEPGVDGDVNTYTDADGRFSIKILKGLKL